VFGVKDRVRVIPNFVNVDTYKPDPQKAGASRFAPAGDKLLIHLSNFRPVKRVLDCIHILARVRKRALAHLLMVGDGPDRGPAEILARDLGVQDHVSFLGKQDHVERLIPLAHVLLMPSELEAFGLAALEAMACGVPPIGTKAGGVPELITHGVDGFIEGVGDLDAQAARAVELLTGDGLHHRMATAARHSAVSRFSTERIIPQYERYYEEICGQRSAGTRATSL
jgi:N-acetyl-alpha-D-glucosaminyl L-malate synthase BshA